MARLVYSGCRQFKSCEELEECVMDTWLDIGQKYLDSLLESMPRRIGEVVKLGAIVMKY